MYINNNEIESYNLFFKRYFEVIGPLEHNKPSKHTKYDNTITFNDYDVNDKGDFIRNYKTLEDAKMGAIRRSRFYCFNKDTIIKDIKNKTAEDILSKD